MVISTICHVEQHPWRSVTFFSGLRTAESPTIVRVLLIPAAVLVPHGLRRVLAISRSDNGIASLFFVLLPAHIAGFAGWPLESLDSSGAYQYPGYIYLRLARTTLAWTSVLPTIGGTAI